MIGYIWVKEGNKRMFGSSVVDDVELLKAVFEASLELLVNVGEEANERRLGEYIDDDRVHPVYLVAYGAEAFGRYRCDNLV